MAIVSMDSAEVAQVQAFVLAERRKSLSEREWHFRLRGYGYGVRECGNNQVLTALPNNTDLFRIDEAVLNAPAAAHG